MKDRGTPPCSEHPDAPHGFIRNASHSLGRYVCECEGWRPEPQFIVPEKPQPVAQWVLIEPQAAQPDCRTCAAYHPNAGCTATYLCHSGDQYRATPQVVLWSTT